MKETNLKVFQYTAVHISSMPLSTELANSFSPIHRVILVILRYKVMLRCNISLSICFCRRVCKTK